MIRQAPGITRREYANADAVCKDRDATERPNAGRDPGTDTSETMDVDDGQINRRRKKSCRRKHPGRNVTEAVLRLRLARQGECVAAC